MDFNGAQAYNQVKKKNPKMHLSKPLGMNYL